MDGVVSSLNEHADGLAEELEAEIMSALPPDPTLSVQVEMRFHKGSLVMLGTVAVISWAGSIVLDTVKAELGDLIKIATQRVLAAAVGRFATNLPGPVTMQCAVTPRPRVERPSTPTAAGTGSPLALQQGLAWRDLLLGVLTLAVVILLFTTLFDVRLRTPTTPAAPVATAPASP